ncbi:uncharacterized protein N7459_007270 [Penicillium hispanicum]|uniref:uncharacterized protein n=1 Tax=Penicillium hispanicum TaxID=1080232 RepID=UPI002541A4BA|nr:uncharacterized protein N7459_007270 [Penicillium hispanicum]KAJ5578306.1 hypothetical protein N7459_007270 [Penicillium hispanicum]
MAKGRAKSSKWVLRGEKQELARTAMRDRTLQITDHIADDSANIHTTTITLSVYSVYFGAARPSPVEKIHDPHTVKFPRNHGSALVLRVGSQFTPVRKRTTSVQKSYRV